MLLSLLSKEEKMYFLDLLNELISVDGAPSDTELNIKNRLKYEMGDEILKYKKSSLSREKLIEYFAKKSYPTKNLVYLNLVAASLNDDWYSVEEHLLLEKIQEEFQIPEKKRTELFKLVYSERDLREKVKRVISE
jgi:hypothetical protein